MLQTNEYLRAFLTGRIGFHKMGMLLIISGAFSAFNKQLVIEAGGFTPKCIGENMELVVKLHQHMLRGKHAYSIKFLPEPVFWTQPPDVFRGGKEMTAGRISVILPQTHLYTGRHGLCTFFPSRSVKSSHIWAGIRRLCMI